MTSKLTTFSLLPLPQSLYRSNLDLRARETELKDEQAELKRGVGEWREKRREAEAERKALTEGREWLARRQPLWYMATAFHANKVVW